MNTLHRSAIVITTFLLLLSAQTLMAQRKLGDNLGSHQAARNLQMNTHQVLNSSGIAIGTTTIVGGSSIGLQLAGGKAIQVTNVSALTQITTPVSGMVVFRTTDQALFIYQGGAWTSFAMSKLPNGQVLIGDASGNAVPRTLSGDVTLNNTGVTTIVTNAVTSGKILDGTIISADMADGAITTNKILNNAVTSAKILDGTILAADLATGAVTSDKILNGTMLAADIATGAVTSAKILDGTIGAVDIADGAVTTAKILDGTILAADIANSAVVTAKIANGAVTTEKILDGTIIANDIATGAVSSAKILDGTVLTADIANNAVTSAKLQSSSTVDANRSVTTDHIKNNAVTTSKISPGTINQVLRTNASGNTEWMNTVVKITSSSDLTLNASTQLQTGRQIILQNTSASSIVRFTLPTGYEFSNTLFGNQLKVIDLQADGSVTINVTEAGKVDILGTNVPPATIQAPSWFFGRFDKYLSSLSSAYTPSPANGENFIFGAGLREGNLTSTTSTITLEPGRTYVLDAYIGEHGNGNAQNPYMYYQWQIGGVNVGNIGLALPASWTLGPYSTTSARAIYRVPANASGTALVARLKMIDKAVNKTINIHAHTSYVSVIELR